jgi:hypothetical protein
MAGGAGERAARREEGAGRGVGERTGAPFLPLAEGARRACSRYCGALNAALGSQERACRAETHSLSIQEATR